MTTLLFVLFALAVLGVVVAVASGVITGGMDDPTTTIPPVGLPEGPVAADDLDQLRFAPALRGYRMAQVDEVLDRLRAELASRDAELAKLRQRRA